MSIKIMTLAWETNLDTSEKFVLLSLADNANAQGICFPSIDYVGKRCGLSERGVYRAIASLKDKGHITVRPRRQRSSFYIVHPDGNVFCDPAILTGSNEAALQEAAQSTSDYVAGSSLPPDVRSHSTGDVRTLRAVAAAAVDPTKKSDPARLAATHEEAVDKTVCKPVETGNSTLPHSHPDPDKNDTQTLPDWQRDPATLAPVILNPESSSESSRVTVSEEIEDGKKNPQDRSADRKPEAKSVGRRRLIHEPTAQELEAARTQQMQRIDAALKRKAAG